MRKASWGGWKRRRPPYRREPGGIEGGVAARAIDRLMGEISHFIDKEANLSHADQMLRGNSGGRCTWRVINPISNDS